MKNLKESSFPTLVLVLVVTLSFSNAKLTAQQVQKHVERLSSDSFEGRYPGTASDQKSGDYIKSIFRKSTLQPVSQSFTFLQSLSRGKVNSLKINGKEILQQDYTPLSFSKDTLTEGELIFTGYGMTIKTDSFEWNDYNGLDLKGKWVMIIRGSPSIKGFDNYVPMGADDRDKVMAAEDKGAIGVILVSGKDSDDPEELLPLTANQSPVGIPVFQLKQSKTDSLLSSSGYSVKRIEELIASHVKTLTFNTGLFIKGQSDLESIWGTTANHYAILEGSDPVLKNEYIVVGGHYDHLGMGGKGSSSRVQDTIAIHNGADDNASGIAAMLGIMENLSRQKGQIRRSVIFIAFGAEEMGLLGSKYFINHSPVELSKIVAMINLDMVGRLDSVKGLKIGGAGTSIGADSLIERVNADFKFKLLVTKEGSGPSDHSSFYSKDIPVFFLTTGAHADYHTPADDAVLMNIEGLKVITSFSEELLKAVCNRDQRLVFTEAGPKEGLTSGHRFKVSLGFMPDFAATDISGVRVDIVTKGKAAERGGIKNGDIITAIDGLKVRNINDYMYRLSKFSKGQIISVEILRKGIKEVLIIQL